MTGIELTAFQIICGVGEAKSDYIEAMREAREGNIKKAEELLEKGRQSFVQGHEAHAELLQQEASGNPVEVRLLLMHAEDQLMSAEDFGVLAREYLELAKKLKQNNCL